MDNRIIITAVTENTCMRHSLLSQHGQSLHINYFGTQYLFDVAEVYEGFIYNLSQMGIDLSVIKGIIISHNHLDHSGSLRKFMSSFTDQKLYLPPDMRNNKEKGYKESYRVVDGKLESAEQAVENILKYPNVDMVENGQAIEKNFFTTGPLEEKTTGLLEQSLAINIPGKGLVILVGCSHPTVPLIIEKAKQVTGIQKIYGLIGGFHYRDSTDEEIRDAVKFLQSLNPEFVVPSHCTGYKAIAAMQKEMGDRIKVSSTGQFGTGNSIQILPELSFNFK